MWPTAIAGATLLSQEARRQFYSETRLSRGLIYVAPLLVKGADVVRGFYVLWLGHDFSSVTTILGNTDRKQRGPSQSLPRCRASEIPGRKPPKKEKKAISTRDRVPLGHDVDSWTPVGNELYPPPAPKNEGPTSKWYSRGAAGCAAAAPDPRNPWELLRLYIEIYATK